MMLTLNELWEAYQTLCADLLAERTSDGHWEGRLASSALATATAIGALALAARHRTTSGLADGGKESAQRLAGSVPHFPDRPDELSDAELSRLIWAGLEWLARTQNADGGWGDTDRSPSNIATTMLVRAAVHLADLLPCFDPIEPSLSDGQSSGYSGPGADIASASLSPPRPTERFAQLLDRAARYIQQQGGLEGLRRRYGKDQTFAVPILTMYALAGLVGWQEVRPLPFEWAVLPHQVLGWVRLPVVSYAIPALVAMGQARFFHLPPKNPLIRWLRAALVEKTLQVLEAKQPASGGFLEAVPLTSFVMMALASTGRAGHPVVQRGLPFLRRTFRPEGAWPIDANLAAWVTTLSLNALLGPVHRQVRPGADGTRTSIASSEGSASTGPSGGQAPIGSSGEAAPMGSSEGQAPIGSFWQQAAELAAIRREVARACWPWLVECQHRKIHPFTHSAPGGWGWTDLAGAVPDADDTAGALLALAAIYQELQNELSAEDRRRILEAVALGLRWLLDLQNRDGGWPTFCRGWGALPFDRSATDLTAHALRALAAWKHLINQGIFVHMAPAGSRLVSEAALQRAIQRGLRYLQRCQNPDGSWTPLWFGNAYWPGEENPIYGTARVLLAYRDLGLWGCPVAQRGLRWLLVHQNPDGGWGGRPTGNNHPSEHQTPLPPSRQEKSWSSASSPDARPNPPGQPIHHSDRQSRLSDWQSSVEETALALEALLADPRAVCWFRQPAGPENPVLPPLPVDPKSQRAASEQEMLLLAMERALAWLVQAVQEGRHRQPEPIGLYFARLWYYEKMYPFAFALSALGEALGCLASVAQKKV